MLCVLAGNRIVGTAPPVNRGFIIRELGGRPENSFNLRCSEIVASER